MRFVFPWRQSCSSPGYVESGRRKEVVATLVRGRWTGRLRAWKMIRCPRRCPRPYAVLHLRLPRRLLNAASLAARIPGQSVAEEVLRRHLLRRARAERHGFLAPARCRRTAGAGTRGRWARWKWAVSWRGSARNGWCCMPCPWVQAAPTSTMWWWVPAASSPSTPSAMPDRRSGWPRRHFWLAGQRTGPPAQFQVRRPPCGAAPRRGRARSGPRDGGGGRGWCPPADHQGPARRRRRAGCGQPGGVDYQTAAGAGRAATGHAPDGGGPDRRSGTAALPDPRHRAGSGRGAARFEALRPTFGGRDCGGRWGLAVFTAAPRPACRDAGGPAPLGRLRRPPRGLRACGAAGSHRSPPHRGIGSLPDPVVAHTGPTSRPFPPRAKVESSTLNFA